MALTTSRLVAEHVTLGADLVDDAVPSGNRTSRYAQHLTATTLRSVSGNNSSLALAERHVLEAEERARRQGQLVAKLEGAGHLRAAQEGRDLLDALLESLSLIRQHLR